ncbi:hypothetical protein THASP1DRAFT_31742 [Thamnocephalis sphaerospora]|uniref:VanZ-like domain-containing protein n=1 Tax=Thamnocephalis sphaerospora TaxID=78915 RepID=A0A4P9XMF9_9FUNG|nr:hypothetical protein THASP1DRAFT_31742 [Thamnocephalis sphaerospora]|eukprot:RKP06440.1 hypothetical protein THASP1DRAFT_31742 [Thamnocephalis sphaerospora]
MARLPVSARRVRDWVEDEVLHRLRPRILLVWLAVLLLMAVLGFTPIHLPFWDKAVHFTSFALLSTLSFFVWDGPRFWTVTIVAGGMVVASIVSEFIQDMLPYRTFDGYDILANLLGSFCGILIALAIDHRYRQRRARMQADYLMLAHNRDWMHEFDDDEGSDVEHAARV